MIAWTKGWTAEGVVGRDVAALLNRALAAERISGVRVVSLNNDTTGTLMARAYLDPDCDAGCILGTGTNICYRERTSEIRKPVGPHGRDHMIINMESGNFNAVLPRNRFDVLLDRSSANPGLQAEEKMVSGKYLGELARLAVVELCGRGRLFGGRLPEIFSRREAFGSERLSEIEKDDSASADGVREFLGDWGARPAAAGDARLLRDVVRAVSGRAARLAAATLGAHWKNIRRWRRNTRRRRRKCFHKYPGFKARMEETLRELFGGRGGRIALAPMRDGSGLGAAVIAAVAAESAKTGGKKPGAGW